MRASAGFVVVVVATLTGCLPNLPENVSEKPDAARSLLRSVDRARFFEESELRDGAWLEVQHRDGSGSVGGYFGEGASAPADRAGPGGDGGEDRPAATGPRLIEPPEAGRGLALVLPGASTFYQRGMIAKARDYHGDFAAELRRDGLHTWTLALPECGTPYGGADLRDALEAIDWLRGAGGPVLGVERVFVVGASAGATIATLANMEVSVDAVVAVSPLARPELLEEHWLFGQLVAALYRDNTGLCQFGTTLVAYGPPGSAGWRRLDLSARVTEITSPMLVVHGMRDVIHPFRDVRDLRSAYDAAVRDGAPLPPIEFAFIPDADHIGILDRDEVRLTIREYLRRQQRSAGAQLGER